MDQHVLIGFTNPYLLCDQCDKTVRYWHDTERCFCDTEDYNSPCEHPLGVYSSCTTWDPVDGCSCKKLCER